MLTAFFVVSLLLADNENSPLDTVTAFNQALADKKPDVARRLLLTAEGEQAKALVERWVTLPPLHKVIEEKVAGDYAVVASLDKPGDPDPLFLVRRDKKWLIVPSQQPDDSLKLSKDDWTELGKLNQWFRDKKPEYRKLK